MFLKIWNFNKQERHVDSANLQDFCLFFTY